MNDGIRADLYFRIDVRRRGVDDGDASRHQLFVLVLSHESAHFRELRSAVDASDLHGIVGDHGLHRQFAPVIDGDQVGQVVLPLRVLSGNAPQRIEQRAEVERIDAGVDFLDLPLGRRGIPLLDDASEPPAGPDDAAIAIRSIDDGGHHRRGCAGAVMDVEQLADGLGPEQRDITREQYDGARLAGQERFCLLERMRRSELRRLQRELDSLPPGQACADRVGSVAHDDRNRCRLHAPRRVEHPFDHWPAGDWMQHFRQDRLHAGALAGREYDDVGLCAHEMRREFRPCSSWASAQVFRRPDVVIPGGTRSVHRLMFQDKRVDLSHGPPMASGQFGDKCAPG